MREARKNNTPIPKLRKLVILIHLLNFKGEITPPIVIKTTQNTKKNNDNNTRMSHGLMVTKVLTASIYLMTPYTRKVSARISKRTAVSCLSEN